MRKALDTNNAHGCNSIYIKMVKICSQSLILPLKINRNSNQIY